MLWSACLCATNCVCVYYYIEEVGAHTFNMASINIFNFFIRLLFWDCCFLFALAQLFRAQAWKREREEDRWRNRLGREISGPENVDFTLSACSRFIFDLRINWSGSAIFSHVCGLTLLEAPPDQDFYNDFIGEIFTTYLIESDLLDILGGCFIRFWSRQDLRRLQLPKLNHFNPFGWCNLNTTRAKPRSQVQHLQHRTFIWSGVLNKPNCTIPSNFLL